MEKNNSNIKNEFSGSSNVYQNDYYIVCVGSLIMNGPEVTADQDVIDAYMEEVRRFNREKNKEVVRVYGPKRK